MLVWEPSAAQNTSYPSSRPALERFYRETKFWLLKSTHSTWNLKTKLRTFPWVSRVSQSKFEANRPRGSWVMIGQTNKQTARDYNFIFIDIDSGLRNHFVLNRSIQILFSYLAFLNHNLLRLKMGRINIQL